MTTLREAAQQALEALESCSGVPHWPALQPTITALRAALEQPKFTLSCGCPSQYGGVPAYWERDGSTAFGMICEKHWHEYGAKAQA
ncbi:MAG: hypothetical protein RLZZ09_3244 [Pseudomonadota bacterium]|jgi:hypothetical protein